MSRKKQYIVLDQIIYKPSGWSKTEYNEFMDSFIELVENFKAQAGGGINYLSTEEDLQND